MLLIKTRKSFVYNCVIVGAVTVQGIWKYRISEIDKLERRGN